MKKWDRSYVKLQDFIIFRWLKDKLDCPVYTRQIYSDKLQNIVNICPY